MMQDINNVSYRSKIESFNYKIKSSEHVIYFLWLKISSVCLLKHCSYSSAYVNYLKLAACFCTYDKNHKLKLLKLLLICFGKKLSFVFILQCKVNV